MTETRLTNLPSDLQERSTTSAFAMYQALDNYGKASKVEKLIVAIQLTASFMESSPELEKAINDRLEIAREIHQHDRKFNLKIIK